jgi:hypothetical protein
MRPHCLQCGSASVIPDKDVPTRRISIYCAMCGNRQYRDTDYIGFEMKEGGGNMSIRATCKNCGREGMSIVREGLCFTCAKVSGEFPEKCLDRVSAMARVAEKAKSLPGPHTNSNRTDVGIHQAAGNASDRMPSKRRKSSTEIRKPVRKRFDLKSPDDRPRLEDKEPGKIRAAINSMQAVYPIAQENLGPAGDPEPKPPRDCAFCPLDDERPSEPIMVQIRFYGSDAKLFHDFGAYCRRHRRDPEGQILALIDYIVADDKALAKELGLP